MQPDFATFVKNFKAGKFFTATRPSGNATHWKIEATNGANKENEIYLEKQQTYKTEYGREWKTSDYLKFSYEEFENYFVEMLKNPDISTFSVNDHLPLLGTLEEEAEYKDKADFEAELDKIDPNNAGKGIEPGMIFGVILPTGTEYAKVHSIDEKTQTLQIELFDGTVLPVDPKVNPLTWMDFTQVIMGKSTNFRRIGDIETPEKFAENMSMMPGENKDGELFIVSGLLSNGKKVQLKTKDEK